MNTSQQKSAHLKAAESRMAGEFPKAVRHLINGNWIDSADNGTFERHSPSHGALITCAAKGGEIEVEKAVASSRQAFDSGPWPRMSGRERSNYLLEIAGAIRRARERIAFAEVLESGKPITQARTEIDTAADIWSYAAALARTHHGDSHNTLGPEILGLVLKEPIGVVAIVTPWNFPFLILSQKLPFVLAAGCTAVVKPSEFTPSTTAMLGEILLESGLPSGVVNIVLGFGKPVGALIATDPRIDMVSFTGSTETGKVIAAAASDTLKKVSLELGGNNAQVIFPDADLNSAIDAIVFGAYFNAGECCNAGSRIIAHVDIAEELIRRVVEHSSKVRVGNPLHDDTKVGAIISIEHLRRLENCVRSAEEAGAKVRAGGGKLPVPDLAGQFFQPTVVTDVTGSMPICRDEVFGPIVSIQTFRSFDEAIERTNETAFGLSAGIWSRNVNSCLEFARQARAGTVWTNTWMDGFAELPFGGMKQSGQGRELGRYGLEEFLEVKTVQMRIGRTRAPWVCEAVGQGTGEPQDYASNGGITNA